MTVARERFAKLLSEGMATIGADGTGFRTLADWLLPQLDTPNLLPDPFIERAVQAALHGTPGEDTQVMLSAFEAVRIRAALGTVPKEAP